MANNDDIFAPPTPEELAQVDADMFAPPSPEELKTAEGPSLSDRAMSALKSVGETGYDALVGAGKGASLGLVDELAGASGAAFEKVLGSDQSWSDLYREYQKNAEQFQQDSAERSPIANTVGNVGGSIASGLATAGAGVGIKGAQAAKTAVPFFSKEFAKRATMGVGKSALTGAGLGAAQGAFESKGTLDDEVGRGQIAEDTYEGAKMGGLFGSGVGLITDVAVPGIKAAAKSLTPDSSSSPYLRQAKYGFDLGKQGKNITNPELLKKELSQQPGKAAEGLLGRINEADEMLGKNVGQSIDDATARGVKIDITPELSKSAENLEKYFLKNPAIDADQFASKTFQKIYTQPSYKFTPDQVRSLRDELDEVLSRLEGDTSTIANAARKNVMDIKMGLMGKLKDQVPQYAEASKRFAEFRQLMPETVLGKGRPEGLTGVQYGKLRNNETKLYDQLKKLVQRSELPGSSTLPEKEIIGSLDESLGQLEKTEAARKFSAQQKGEQYETIFDRMGKDRKQLLNEIKGEADKSAAVSQAIAVDPQGSVTGKLISLLTVGQSSTGRGAGIVTANVAGRAAEKTGKQLSRLTRALSDSTDTGLSNIADSLENVPGLSSLGTSLKNAINEKNTAAKNAALFIIMQNPEARKFLSEEE